MELKNARRVTTGCQIETMRRRSCTYKCGSFGCAGFIDLAHSPAPARVAGGITFDAPEASPWYHVPVRSRLSATLSTVTSPSRLQDHAATVRADRA